MQIKLYTNLTCYTPERRPYLADLLRPLINQRTLEKNRGVYGDVVDRYILVDSLEQADWAILPLAWNYYHRVGQISQVLEFIERARKAGKPILTWLMGDFGARVPVKDVWVFGAAGYKRCAGVRRFGTPVFINDPLPVLGITEVQPRPKGASPRIGFCGYARISTGKAAGVALRTLLRNMASALHWSGDEPQDIVPPVLLRQHILDLLYRSPQVETDFIQRVHYKAGAHTPGEEQKVRREFFGNIRDTDYTVCVRGSGNFSARLYETLAMGRIPILVDTDCLLPYADDPRWRECCVYVRWGNVDQIVEKVQAFHDRLSESAFIETQRRARRFWEERLSFNGFFTHFPEHLSVGASR